MTLIKNYSERRISNDVSIWLKVAIRGKVTKALMSSGVADLTVESNKRIIMSKFDEGPDDID